MLKWSIIEENIKLNWDMVLSSNRIFDYPQRVRSLLNELRNQKLNSYCNTAETTKTNLTNEQNFIFLNSVII